MHALLCCAALCCRYNAWNYTRLDSSGQFIRHQVPMGDIAVHYRGGSIIPMQPYANLTKIVRYTPVTLVVTLPAHPSGTPGAPLPPYATEEACAAVHAAHPGQLVSCGVLFMDTPDDTDITPGNSVEVSKATAAGIPSLLHTLCCALSLFSPSRLGLARNCSAADGSSLCREGPQQPHRPSV